MNLAPFINASNREVSRLILNITITSASTTLLGEITTASQPSIVLYRDLDKINDDVTRRKVKYWKVAPYVNYGTGKSSLINAGSRFSPSFTNNIPKI